MIQKSTSTVPCQPWTRRTSHLLKSISRKLQRYGCPCVELACTFDISLYIVSLHLDAVNTTCTKLLSLSSLKNSSPNRCITQSEYLPCQKEVGLLGRVQQLKKTSEIILQLCCPMHTIFTCLILLLLHAAPPPIHINEFFLLK